MSNEISDLYAQLLGQTARMSWAEIMPIFAKGMVLWVASNQDLVAVAEQIMAKAREAAAQDHERMLGELKREVGKLVGQATAAVTGKILTLEDQQRLAEETAKQLAV